MSEKLTYILELKVEDETNLSQVEALLKETLVDLYQNDDVKGVRVIDRNEIPDDAMEELVSILHKLDSKSVKGSIRLAEEMKEDEDD